MSKYGSIILPEYFEQEDEESIANAIHAYRETYGRSPTDPADVIQMTSPSSGEIIYTLYEMSDDVDTDLAADVVIQFAKEQAAKLAVLSSMEDIKHGNLTSMYRKLEDAMRVGKYINSPGIDPVRDLEKWLYTYWDDKVPTGWLHVDRILEGGLKGGELGIVLGPPNRGKSMALVNIGYGAASIYGGGKNVVHFVHEMSAAQTAKRYAARMVFRFPTKDEDLDAYGDDVIAAAKHMMPGNVRIIGGAEKMSTTDIESNLEMLLAEGFNFDVIIDDYPDLLDPPKTYTDRRFELSAVFEWFRNIAGKYGVPVWGATQGNRNSLSKEIVTMQDIAEDIGKANIADVIIAVCQTLEEEQSDRCRLFMAKVRDGEKKSLIASKYFGKSQSIVTTGIIDLKKRESNV